jgi:hypothetical protein
MNRTFLFLLVWLAPAFLIAFGGSAQGLRVTNDYADGAKKGSYNWKIYLQGSAATLASIASVEYTFHPTFRKPVQLITASPRNPNFSFVGSGWGEFDVKVKIVFKNPGQRPLYLVYPLDLHSRARKIAVRSGTNVYFRLGPVNDRSLSCT